MRIRTAMRRRSGSVMQPRLGMLCTAVACLIVFGASMYGEDDRPVDDVPTDAQAREDQTPGVDMGALFDGNLVERFTNNIFLSSGDLRPSSDGGDAVPESPTLAMARKLSEERLGQVESDCGLSDIQRRKLRLAMEMDVRRLEEAIDEVRQKYRGVVIDGDVDANQREWQRMQWQFREDVLRCRQQLQALFDADSLFAKVLATTLDPEQHAKLTAVVGSRHAYRWKALVAAGMMSLDDKIGLDGRQYEEIEKLLLERPPLLRMDGPAAQQMAHARHLVFTALAGINGKRLRAIVSERQWQMLSQLANEGAVIRSDLVSQGLLEKPRK